MVKQKKFFLLHFSRIPFVWRALVIAHAFPENFSDEFNYWIGIHFAKRLYFTNSSGWKFDIVAVFRAIKLFSWIIKSANLRLHVQRRRQVIKILGQSEAQVRFSAFNVAWSPSCETWADFTIIIEFMSFPAFLVITFEKPEWKIPMRFVTIASEALHVNFTVFHRHLLLSESVGVSSAVEPWLGANYFQPKLNLIFMDSSSPEINFDDNVKVRSIDWNISADVDADSRWKLSAE